MAAGPKRQSSWKTPGTRTAFSQGFIRDFALVWAEEGLEAVRKVGRRALRPLWRSQLAFVPTMSGSRLNKRLRRHEHHTLRAAHALGIGTTKAKVVARSAPPVKLELPFVIQRVSLPKRTWPIVGLATIGDTKLGLDMPSWIRMLPTSQTRVFPLRMFGARTSGAA